MLGLFSEKESNFNKSELRCPVCNNIAHSLEETLIKVKESRKNLVVDLKNRELY